MKDKINEISARMNNLDAQMNKITHLTSKIDNNLKVKRKEIQKLDIVNNDLQKLNKLCEFPQILKQDLEQYH